MTGTNDKLRGLFLAALMVLSVFAGTVAFSGSVAAASNASFDNNGAEASQYSQLHGEFTFKTGDAAVGNSVSSIKFSFAGSTGQSTGAAFDGSFNDVTEDDIRVVITNPSGGTQADYTLDTAITDRTSATITVSFPSTDIEDGDTIELQIQDNFLNPTTPDDYEGTITVFNTNGGGETQTTADLKVAGSNGGGDGAAGPAFDDTWESTSRRWQGQVLLFDGAPSGNSPDYALYQCTWDAGVGVCEEGAGGFVTELTYNDTNDPGSNPYVAFIDTDGLEGTYVIKNGDGQVIYTDAQGDQTDTGAKDENADLTFENPTLAINVQTLSVNWQTDSVTKGGSAVLNLDSNRNDYNVSISSDDLSSAQLLAMFNVNNTTSDGGAIVEINGSDAQISAAFSPNLDTGTYNFDVEVLDTGVSDSDSIEVVEPGDTQATFVKNIYSEQRGDVASITLELQNTQQAVVTIGSAEVNYKASVRVEDADDDGKVTLLMNTYLASREGIDQSAVFAVPTGSGDDLGFVDPQINQTDGDVLDATDYDLSVRIGSREKDVAVLSLQKYEFEGIEMYTAPSQDGGASTFGDFAGAHEVANATIKSSEIADGDLVVLKVNTNGVFGYLENYQDIVGDDGNNNLSVEITPAFQNVNDVEGAVDKPVGAVYAHPHADELYIVYDADDLEAELDEGKQYNITFSIEETAGANRSASITYTDGEEKYDDYPAASGTVQFTLVDREAEFDTNSDGDIVVYNADGQTISGTTTAAPGTEFNVRIKATGDSPFLKSKVVTVQDDGTFSATFDLSNVSAGTDFTASIPNGGFENEARTPGVVKEVPTASVTFNNQTTTGDSLVVASVTMNYGGFVAIHDATLLEGAVFDSVRGVSEYLEAGTHEDVVVQLDDPIHHDGRTFIAMPHLDTNGNEVYDFVTSQGAEDGPFPANNKFGIAVDTAVVNLKEYATVTFRDQTTQGDSLVVQSVSLPDGGFVTIHDSTLADGKPFSSVRGTSAFLAPGEHTNVQISLDDPIEQSGTFIAMAHKDTNGNQVYDFVTSQGANDGPYITAGGNAVIDKGVVTLAAQPTPTPTPTPEPDPTPTQTPDQTAEPTETATATEPPTTTDEGPGFGVVVALVALVAAALLAVRRD